MQEYIEIQTAFNIILRDCQSLLGLGDSVFRELMNVKAADTLVREQTVLANNLQKHMVLIQNTCSPLKMKFRRLKILNRTENPSNFENNNYCSVFHNLIIND